MGHRAAFQCRCRSLVGVWVVLGSAGCAEDLPVEDESPVETESSSSTDGTGDGEESGFDGLSPVWENTVAGKDSLGAARHLAVAPNGDVVVLGSAGAWMWLGRFSAEGQLLWEVKDQQGDSLAIESSRMVLDAQDNITLVTSNDLSGQVKLLLWKFDAAGTELWKLHEGAGPRTEQVTGLVHDGAGNIYIAGTAAAGAQVDVWLASYDQAGAERWYVVHDTETNRHGIHLLWDPVGSLAVVESEGRSIALRRYALDGSLVSQTPLFASTWPIAVWSVTYAPNGSLLLAGTESVTDTAGVVGSEAWVRAFDSAGLPLWTTPLPDVVMRVGAGVRSATDGSSYVAASSLDGLDQNLWLGRFDLAGTLNATYGYDSGAWDEGRSVTLLDDGTAILGGSAEGGLGKPPVLWLSKVAFDR